MVHVDVAPCFFQVGEAMTPNPVSATPGMKLQDAAKLMLDKKVRARPA